MLYPFDRTPPSTQQSRNTTSQCNGKSRTRVQRSIPILYTSFFTPVPGSDTLSHSSVPSHLHTTSSLSITSQLTPLAFRASSSALDDPGSENSGSVPLLFPDEDPAGLRRVGERREGGDSPPFSNPRLSLIRFESLLCTYAMNVSIYSLSQRTIDRTGTVCISRPPAHFLISDSRRSLSLLCRSFTSSITSLIIGATTITTATARRTHDAMRRVGIGMIESRVGGQRGFLVLAAIVTEMEGGSRRARRCREESGGVLGSGWSETKTDTWEIESLRSNESRSSFFENVKTRYKCYGVLRYTAERRARSNRCDERETTTCRFTLTDELVVLSSSNETCTTRVTEIRSMSIPWPDVS